MKISPLLLTLLYFSCSFFILWKFNGTGGEADSINHYLHAKYAPSHPELYLDHWAKPFFTLLASPFAQFGFVGVKVFNILCSFISFLFVYKIASVFHSKHSFLAPLFLITCPLFFLTTFSGLTEPLAAAVLTVSIFLLLKKKYQFTALLISVLPFVRSEGLIIIGVFSVFFLFKKEWKSILLLSFSHIVFSIVGYFHYQDFLWVFTKIPYSTLSSHYGSGQLFHFADKLIYITGIPLLVLFLGGKISLVIKNYPQQLFPNWLLIVSTFLSFFIAHSLFWYLGIFNSMGLKRVFATVLPLIALICFQGFNLLDFVRLKNLRIFLKVGLVIYVLIFPFTSNPAAVNWGKEMNLSFAQNTAEEVAQFLLNGRSTYRRFVYTDPYLGEALGIDPFDPDQRLILSPQALEELKTGDIIIWDNWHAVIDYDVEKTTLESFQFIKEFKNGNSTYLIFEVP